MIKRISYKIFLRQYKYELIAFIVNVLVVFFAFKYEGNKSITFAVVVSVLIISLFIIIYYRTKDKDFYYLTLNKPGGEKDWVGQ